MPDIVVKAKELSKKYIIGHQAENGRYLTLRDMLMQNARSVWHKTKDLVQGKPIIQGDTLEEVWALKDVSFAIQRGESVGIIGRNGAGKSTLLKILSRITEPSAGRVTIKGRVASLLEVGTGFHPELTGRENIYLNGAILGLTRLEIKRKFDEIVAFAEIQKFLDTPVKRYSSGMYVRLAFAVAAHVEPEILVVDEVLAVGDAAFQKKCLGKMKDVSSHGRTILFVSHNLAALSSICASGILLERGRLVLSARMNEVLAAYVGSLEDGRRGTSMGLRSDRVGNGKVRISDMRIVSAEQAGPELTEAAGDLVIELEYVTSGSEPCRNVSVAVGVHGPLDEPLFHLSTTTCAQDFECIPRRGVFVCRVPNSPLASGRYPVNVFVSVKGEIADWIQNAGAIDATPRDPFGTGRVPPADQGHLYVRHDWSVKALAD
jgi:lipopolysaccharide transport system ATP-binding protein